MVHDLVFMDYTLDIDQPPKIAVTLDPFNLTVQHIQNFVKTCSGGLGQTIVVWQVNPDEIWRNRCVSSVPFKCLGTRAGETAGITLIIARDRVG